MECGSSVVEHFILKWAPGFESSSWHLEASAIMLPPRCINSFSCINEYLAVDRFYLELSLCVVTAQWVKASQTSRIGDGKRMKYEVL